MKWVKYTMHPISVCVRHKLIVIRGVFVASLQSNLQSISQRCQPPLTNGHVHLLLNVQSRRSLLSIQHTHTLHPATRNDVPADQRNLAQPLRDPVPELFPPPHNTQAFGQESDTAVSLHTYSQVRSRNEGCQSVWLSQDNASRS